MSEDTLTRPALNLSVFEKAAELIREHGFWDGVHDETQAWTAKRGYCIGLAIIEQENLNVSRADIDVAMGHLAAQLGYTAGTPFVSSHGFIFNKNDEFRGRPEEGKAWTLDVLDKLARGESL